MRKILLLLLTLLVGGSLAYAQEVHLAAKYNFPTDDPVLSGLYSIRGVNYAADPFGDGTPAIVATNYFDQGHVSVFIPVGQDSLQLVWTSPTVAANGGGSTPRYALFGDLDGDGLVEVIYQSAGNGIYIFEWDGVKGSYNFGTEPSQIISDGNTTPAMAAVSGNCEYMEVGDFDGDGQQELSVAYNSSSNSTDGYYIISASGTWNTGQPLFSAFNVEYEGLRPNLATYGLSGSPWAMIAADFEGNNKQEILVHAWNHKDITMLNPTGPNTYKLADTTNGKQNIMLGGALDEVALFGGMATDIDGDGRQEVYLPTYPGQDNGGKHPHTGWVHMIHFENGQSTTELDSTNVFVLDLSSLLPDGYPVFGYGYGDIDGNGKPNLYFSSSYPYNVMSAEFEGGDKTDMANWKLSVLYPGDSTIISSMSVRDSAGVSDTVKHVQTAFVSKMFDHYTHLFSKDKEDMILPYQSINDSITTTTLTWNSGTSAYDTTVTKMLNPKRYSLRVLEQGAGMTGVKSKDVTIVTPSDFTLDQNYPNPFNPTTSINFKLPLKSRITLKIYDMLGHEIATLINNQVYASGVHQVSWDGTNSAGVKVASGNYIYQLKFGNFTKSKKMTLLK